MVAKKFSEVFGKLSISPDVKLAFDHTKVTEVKISRKNRVMEIKLRAPFVVNEGVSPIFKSDIIRQIPGVRDVRTEIFYEMENQSREDMIRELWENILFQISEESPAAKGMMNDAQWELLENELIIKVKNNAAYFLLKKGIGNLIEKKLEKQADFIVKVRFKNIRLTKEEKESYELEQRKKETQLIANVQQAQRQVEQQREDEVQLAASENISKGILIGKEIKGDVERIINTKVEGETVVIQGYVFNVEPKEIKGGKYIVTFDITDKSDSTTVKFFCEKAVFDNQLSAVLKEDAYVKVRGTVQFDKYSKELNIMSRDISLAEKPPERMDLAEEKRVELHLHTSMSSMDGITSAEKYIKRAAKWGHKAIAITDHGVVQAFPEAMNTAKKTGVKVIYGVEAYLIDDLGNTVICPKGQSLDSTFVVFDIETTGLSNERDRITEIGAVKVNKGQIVDRFSTFVNPQCPIPEKIVELTHITDDMVKDAPVIETVLPAFMDFCQDAVLVAHNAGFDVGFIKKKGLVMGIDVNNTYLDTVELSRSLLPDLSKHKLNIVAERLGVSLEGHHRAVNDAEATAEIFIKFVDMLQEKGIYHVDDINVFSSKTVNYKKLKAHHAIILVKNQTGMRNLYELISSSHINYFFRRPRIPKSEFLKHREGLLIGSACEAGELYRALLDHRPKEIIEALVNFYDYLEIQPIGNNRFMIMSDRIETINSEEDLCNINRQIVRLGEEFHKPVVATCDVHFIDPEDEVYRRIIMAAEGFDDADKQPPLFLRTTEEMLREFTYLGEDKAKEVVITNTNLIADMIEMVKPIPDETYPPKIDGAEEQIRQIAMDKAHELYGDPLPKIVNDRLEKELNSIIKNGFSVLYIIAQRLVWKSNEDGYIVGSRGSVGSSFVAHMTGITEVNSLPAHYVCRKCKYSDFDSDVVKATQAEGGSGCDMPEKRCPVCGEILVRDGHDIPFETFLGFNGDKEPDIDLNFSGEYQQRAHAYTEELFGKGKVFKAGTIGALADKTAYGFVKKYLDERGIVAHNAEINRLVKGCTGIKRTTGQHPGGLMVVPSDHDITEFCPIQRPANDVNSTITTTHFDYHSISGRILKLDELGHDDPTVIRMLYDISGVNPQSVPLGDKKTMSLFESPSALGVTAEDINCPTGTLGIPEFGTKFVIKMLLDTKPKTFADLLRISGLSHGTDVWANNAQLLIENGTITLKDTISTRDSIMIYLINKGVEKKHSFKIMERVRKGKGLEEDDIKAMKAANVPQWYIDSCLKIKYMFPKAHAAAYVMQAFRIAYFKVYYPDAYYASYFTIRACDDFDYSCMCKGMDVAKEAIREIEAKGMSATAKEKSKLTVLEIIVEYYARGYQFLPIDLYKSDAKKFIVTEHGLIPPFSSLQGLGVTAAQSIVDARKAGPFTTIEDFKNRTSVGKTLIELLKEHGVMKGIPETNQLSLFS